MASGDRDLEPQIYSERPLGEGSYGTVYEGTWNRARVAVKKLKSGKSSQDCFNMREIMPLKKKLNHRNVVDILALKETHVVMELCDKNLADLLGLKPKKDRHLNSASFNEENFMQQIASGLEYLHSNGIIHRDLKPDNVLVKQASRTLVLKLCDFGLCGDVSFFTHRYTVAGTERWLAPEFFGAGGEMLEESKHYPYIDIFSMGKIFALIAEPSVEQRKKISTMHCGLLSKKGIWKMENFGIDWSRKTRLCRLVKSMMAVNDKDRPTAAEVVEQLEAMQGVLLVGGFVATDKQPSDPNPFGWELCVRDRPEWCTDPTIIVSPGASICPIPGGFITVGPFKEVRQFQQRADGSWMEQTIAWMPCSRRWAGVACCAGRIYIFGGLTDDDTIPVDQVDCLDLGSRKWMRLRDDKQRYSSKWPILAVYGKFILVIFNTTDSQSRASGIPVECYDTEKERWVDVPFLSSSVTTTAGASATALLDDASVYLVGGHDHLCLRYSFETKEWVELTAKPRQLHLYGSAFIRNACVMLCCGEGSDGCVEAYDPDLNWWTLKPWNKTPNIFHHTALMI